MKPMLLVDLETTGLDPSCHAIIEVSALLVDPQTFEIKDQYNTYVFPFTGAVIDERAMAVNKIDIGSLENLNAAPPLDVMQRLAQMAVGTQLVGHGIAFDKGFLDANAKGFLGTPLKLGTYRLVDTQSMARSLEHKGLVESCSLEALCTYFGISNDGAHSATADTRRTLEVYKRLVNL